MPDTTHRQAAVKYDERYQAELAAIRADDNLSTRAKHRLMARSYLQAKPQLAELKRQHDAEVQAEHLRRQQAAFGRPAAADALRSALETVSKASTQEQVETLLSRAERVGDEVTAAAAFEIGTERGYGRVVEAYTARRPDAAAALHELEAFEADMSDINQRVFSPFNVRKPAELPSNSALVEELAREAADSGGRRAPDYQ